ncbi:hypothetical protein JCM18905_1309 [Vibrio sp. JCM 18905]|nr:hypothetical protein JCM18905_1309 [Vibrio sp. JCM 18905]
MGGRNSNRFISTPPNVREAPVALLEKSAPPDNTGVLQTYKQKMVKIRSSTHAKQ